ncbi:MAG: XRE family transcriptional regulator [Cyanobacteria bacterium J06638_28]
MNVITQKRPSMLLPPEFAIAEAENLQIRTELMLALQRYIQQQEWTLEEAAKSLRQTLPRMQNLMNGEIHRFSVEQLIQLLTLVGLHVQVAIIH